MASGGAATVDHHREPCPDRILDDVGGAFSMGCIGGGFFHAGKEFIWGPKAYKWRSATEVRPWSRTGVLAGSVRAGSAHACG